MKPTLRELARVLCVVAHHLGADDADYCFEGRFRFELGEDWTLVLSSDDAGRIRLEACYRSRVRRTMWTRAGDLDRLGDLVLSASQEAAALAA